MTRIEFYSNADPKLHVACQLVAKAFQDAKRVLVLVPDESVCRTMDRLLWTFQATGFIPHCMSHHALASETPVLIARDGTSLPHDEVLLNLSEECPSFFARFERLIEVVGRDDVDKQLGRNRYRFYRDRGFEIAHKNWSESLT